MCFLFANNDVLFTRNNKWFYSEFIYKSTKQSMLNDHIKLD